MEIRFLGTGASEGVPVVGCECTHCMVAQEEGRSTRLRTVIQVTQDERSILLNAGVDIRRQLLASENQCIDAILISHEHGVSDRYETVSSHELPSSERRPS